MRVLEESAAGDVRHAPDVDLLHQREDGLHVDARRLEERVAQRRRFGSAAKRLAEVGFRDLEDPADQRKPVRVRPARREPEEGVAGPDARPVDGLRLFDDADCESGEIVFAGNEGVRMLGRLPADQRAARHLATGGDALDHFGGDCDFEPFADVIVQEEQRFGTLDEDVVDAHRDQIDADRIVPVECERELQLGADAIGAGDEHRLPVPLRKFDQGAKAADAGQDLRAHRALRIRLDPLDQRIARVDVDAGVAVRKRGLRVGSGDGHRREAGGPRSLAVAGGAAGLDVASAPR